MRDRTKLCMAVTFGTILIELSLFSALWLLFLSALPLMAAFDRNLMHGSLSVLTGRRPLTYGRHPDLFVLGVPSGV